MMMKNSRSCRISRISSENNVNKIMENYISMGYTPIVQEMLMENNDFRPCFP
jgi:hypothetical protein